MKRAGRKRSIVIDTIGLLPAVLVTAASVQDPGKPRIAWNDVQARADLVNALVGDALQLLGYLPGQPLDDKAANAVGLLALVAGQEVEPA